MRRRTVLSLVGAGTTALAGCTAPRSGTGKPRTERPDHTERPAACPTTQSLGVEWPADLTADAVESFVAVYEDVYYRDVVVEYDPDSRFDSYQLETWITEGATPSGDGYEVAVSGGGAIYHSTFMLEASAMNASDDTVAVSASEIDDQRLADTLSEAAATGSATVHVEDQAQGIQYVDTLASLSESFDGPAGTGDADSLVVAVDNTTVDLTVTATQFHGDYGWKAFYYVDDTVVRRTTDEGADPERGDVLECRRER